MSKAQLESAVAHSILHGGERALSALEDSTTSDQLRDRLIRIRESVTDEIGEAELLIKTLLQQLHDTVKVNRETTFQFERIQGGVPVFDAIDASLAETRKLAIFLLDTLRQSTYLRLKLKDIEENLEKIVPSE